MTTFNTFSDILPDPVNKITEAGDTDPRGVAGPGFSGVSFTSHGETQVSRTNSGSGVQRDQGIQYWSFSIKYNPMLREQFEPVDAFLASRNARKYPFFVILPQYSRPRDPEFALFAKNNNITIASTTLSGSSAIMISAASAILGNPRIGDMFNIDDDANVNHLKTYKVTRVETDQRYQSATTAPTTLQKRIHISPPLLKDVEAGAKLVFINPKFRVIAKSDLREYDLNTEQLYSFSLDVEEIMP